MASTIAELASVTEVSPGLFESRYKPEKLGNAANIAYGGCTLAFAVNAACTSVGPKYRLYTAMGSYLSPAFTNRNLLCTVRNIRDTRTFATRQVDVSQKQDDGGLRSVLLLLADFQVPEKATLLTYSAQPSLQPHSRLADAPSAEVMRQRLVRDKGVPQAMADMQKTAFGLLARFFEQRPCPEGILGQTLNGVAKRLPTTQEHLALPEKRSMDWFRSRHSLQSHAEHAAVLAFMLDGALSFVPLSHSHMFLDDAGACSSLDFALRVFVGDISLEEWHVRELGTVTGGEGRAYTEARMWNEKGTMVANMTQQTILRPKPAKKAAL